MKIRTLPVYSRLADENEIPGEVLKALPHGWQLSKHQVETYRALASGDYDVIFNTAMTGDGKSLAAYLRTLVRMNSVLAMYPTNELAFDQETQLERARIVWNCPDLRLTPMSAHRMEGLIADGLYGRKADVVRHLMDNNDIVLTNPDIFHYLAQFFYTRKDDAPDLLFSRKVVELFDLFLFDEFHIFQAPQSVAVFNALLLLREISGDHSRKRYLFLSATPSELLQDYLTKAGFRSRLIHPEAEGWYLNTDTVVADRSWRPIVQAIDLNFWEISTSNRIEAWVTEHIDDILLPFFIMHQPSAKGAIIVNSVATAYRLHDLLRPRFQALGLDVSLNTGFTGETHKRASLDANLLIGTSTVDVGVDFRINFLVFESRDAGTFLQRFGRLGRHLDDGHGHRFETFQAHAMLPVFVKERLFLGKAGEPPCFLDGQEATRTQLAAVIQQAYPAPVSFQSYGKQWGKLQAAHIYFRLSAGTIKSSYENTRAQLKNHYQNVFGISLGKALLEYRDLCENRKEILHEAESFRGESPFDCGIIDPAEAGVDGVKRYGLLGLAANADLTWIERQAFQAEARRRGVSLSDSAISKMIGWFRLERFISSPRSISFVLGDAVSAWGADTMGEVTVIDGVKLDVGGVDWLYDLNASLRKRKLVATVCLMPPTELRYRLKLPPMFEVMPFVDINGYSGSIAFARYALLLNVAIREQHLGCGGNAIIV